MSFLSINILHLFYIGFKQSSDRSTSVVLCCRSRRDMLYLGSAAKLQPGGGSLRRLCIWKVVSQWKPLNQNSLINPASTKSQSKATWGEAFNELHASQRAREPERDSIHSHMRLVLQQQSPYLHSFTELFGQPMSKVQLNKTGSSPQLLLIILCKSEKC